MSESLIQPKSRQCEECRKTLPLNPRNFRRKAGTQSAFGFVCRKCLADQENKARLDTIEAAALETFTARAVQGGSKIPHSAELLESIMGYFGGVNGFASLLLKQYFEAKPGSRIRSQILETVVKLAAKNTDQGGARKPVTLYTDEELEDEINKRLEQAVLTYKGNRYINAPKEEASHSGALPAPESYPESVELPVGGVEGTSGGIEREANRSLEAIQANRQAMGIPPVPGQ